jgi:biotin carboxyl carrier protein
MAELTGPEEVATTVSRRATDASAIVPDPRAIRVRLAAASRTADEPALLVGPAPQPLRMTNPTVGTGPLGGISIAPESRADPDVLVQRQVLVDGAPTSDSIQRLSGGRHVLRTAAGSSRVVIESATRGEGGTCIHEVLVDGFRFLVETEPERVAALRERATKGRTASAHSGPLQVKAIIPGKVVAVSVGVGDSVTAGQQLLVVEAMKMQNELRAPKDGTIERVGVAVGVNIEVGDLLVVID